MKIYVLITRPLMLVSGDELYESRDNYDGFKACISFHEMITAIPLITVMLLDLPSTTTRTIATTLSSAQSRL